MCSDIKHLLYNVEIHLVIHNKPTSYIKCYSSEVMTLWLYVNVLLLFILLFIGQKYNTRVRKIA